MKSLLTMVLCLFLLLTSFAAVQLPELLPQNDTFEMIQDTHLEVNAPGVLSNDNQNQGLGLSAELLKQPKRGSLTFNPDGSFTYVPKPYFNGEDHFTYRAKDGTQDTLTATVTILVKPKIAPGKVVMRIYLPVVMERTPGP